MRGPKPDPLMQAAKGDPGKRAKRRTKADRAADAAKALADRAASIAAAAPESPDHLAPPAFLDSSYGAALAIWNEYVPKLQRLRNFQDIDRLAFAQFCVAYDTWLRAEDDRKKVGDRMTVKAIAGGDTWKANPSIGASAAAFRQCQELMEKFGLTPLDRARLLRDRRALPSGVWETGVDAEQSELPLSPHQPNTAAGMMDTFDSPGPPPPLN